MKIAATLLVVSIALTSVGQTSTSQYHINGRIENIPTGKATIYRIENARTLRFIDSAVVRSNEFTFKGELTDPELVILAIKGMGMHKIFLENSPIAVHFDTEKKILVSGSTHHQIYTDYQLQVGHIDELISAFSDATIMIADVQTTIDSLRKEKDKVNASFINQYANTFFGTWLAYNQVDEWSSSEEIDSLLSSIPEKLKTTRYAKLMSERAEKVRHLSIGKIAPDFILPDLNDKQIGLDAFRGQYVLIDFWASWCGPCRAEHPEMKTIFEEYKGRAFQIVGISLDTDKEAWKKAIAKDSISWMQLNANGFSDPIARQYNVFQVPVRYLLDQNGRIIARDVGINQLRKILKVKLNP
jgi:peroxiredoxin